MMRVAWFILLSLTFATVALVAAPSVSACGVAGWQYRVEIGPIGLFYWMQCDVAIYDGCGNCIRVQGEGPVPFDERVIVLP